MRLALTHDGSDADSVGGAMASSTNQQFTEAVEEARKQAEQGERQRKQSPSAMKAAASRTRAVQRRGLVNNFRERGDRR